MFFKESSPSIIEEYKLKELEDFLQQNNIHMNIVDCPTLWAAFANKYGREHGLKDHTAASFSYMVSMFIAGMGVSAGTEFYFKEEEIEFKIFDRYNKLDETVAEEENIKILFFFIFDIYVNEIEKYEKKIKRIDFRVSQSEYEDFMEVEGGSKVDKLRTLLNNYHKE